jgi:probable HAF family extracellular repeat protein
MNRHISFLVVLIMCICNFSQATTYNVTDLGTLGGSWSGASSINESGQIAGSSSPTASGDSHAFLYSGGTMRDLGTLSGTSSYAYGINNSGQVVGKAAIGKDYLGNFICHAFLYSGSTMTDLGTFGGEESIANDINDSGQVAGWADLRDNEPYICCAFLYNGSSMHSLGAFGYWGSSAMGINNYGQVVGETAINEIDENGNPVHHAFLYSDGTMTDLGTLGGMDSYAYGINDSGQIVGEAAQTTGSTAYHAFLYSDGTMKDLGTLGGLSYAQGINANGQIVGASQSTGYTFHAFLYDGSTMTDLNTLINPSSGWTLNYANDINDAGQIVGQGYNGSEYHAFLLTPKSAEFNWLNTNGSWDSASNWNPDTVPQLGGKAIFANAAATVTLDGNRTVSDLEFNGGSYTISLGSVPSSKLILQSPGNWATTIDVLAGSHIINVPLEMDSDLTIYTAEGATLTMDQISDLDGSKNLTVNGDLTASSVSVGTLTILSGATLTIAPLTGSLLSVPEPSTCMLLFSALLGLGWVLLVRRRM